MHKYINQSHPELLERILIDFCEKNAATNYTIFTSPYCPKFQPIERVWGWSKNFVAQLFYSGRKLEQTYAQMVAVWYGGFLIKLANRTQDREKLV